ncbi:MAG TPA: FtsQ-type POTRA domain-containing protein [Acidimicrobiia bacterium]|nr:FtsQ-type POTRA domain-containing protein [Acidimicrobiia bacterium]
MRMGSAPPTRARGHDRIERPMPRATRRRLRWLEPVARAADVLAVRPPSPAVEAADDDACYALVVDVPGPDEHTSAVPGSPGGDACYALVVEVPDAEPVAPPAPAAGDHAAGAGATVVPFAPPDRTIARPGARPPARPPGPARPAGPGGPRSRDDGSGRAPARPTGPRPHRPDGDHRPRPVTAHAGRPAGPPTEPPVRPEGGTQGAPAAAEAPSESDDGSPPAPAVAVDPRLRARWVAVRRAEGRRRLRVLVVLVGLLTLVTLAVAAVYSPMLDVEHVEVSGVDPATAAAVRTAAGVSRGDALLRVDTGRVEARLERLPWIAHAGVSRDLPGTLHIAVTPRVAVGWVAVPAPRGSKAAPTVAVVDGSGRVMQGALLPPAGLPQLLGTPSRGRIGSRIGHPAVARVARILPADLRARAGSLEVKHGMVTMGLDHGPQIRFGTPHALALKGRTALAILASLRTTVHYIDVGVPSAPVTG